MTAPAGRPSANPRYIPLLVHGIWISGIILSVACGIAAREVLIARGVSVVSWSRGISLMTPLVLWAEIPFILLAVFVRARLRRTLMKDPVALRMWLQIGLGALVGTLAVQGYVLFGMVSYDGPGGFAEVVSMVLVLSLLTIPYNIAVCALGAIAGAGLVWLFWIKRMGREPPAA